METVEVDIVIVGAGIYGIAFARTYLEVHPECNLLVLDQDSSIGGTWNARRNYDAFWSQTGLRMTEFSDMPLILPPEAETYHDTFKAENVTRYLQEYVDKNVYGGRSLGERMLFNVKVDSIEKGGADEIWSLRCTQLKDQKKIRYSTPKLAIATGMTSEPNMPDLPNRSSFLGPILHQKDYGESSVLTSPDVQNIAVLGGGKSAADMVYAAAKAGKPVSWIIRESGTGPAAFIDVKGRGSYMNAAEIGNTRLMTALGPTCFAPQDGWSSFLHRTKIGLRLARKVWNNADRDIRDEAKFQNRPGAKPGYRNLDPSTIVFWCNGAVGLQQHPDFWETIATKVDVYRSDITTLNPNSITLKSGPVIQADALLCGTGWSQSYSFFTPTLLCELGLPHSLSCHCLEDAAYWMSLAEAADREVLSQFPRLAHPPPYFKKTPTKTPYRLYKNIAPLDDESIVFLGQIRIANNFRVSECQALWATAYLDNKLPLPHYDDMQAEIAWVIAWCQRRYPTNGGLGNFFHYDVIGYTDTLLAELELKSHRKRNWWKDFVSPCFASDLKGLREEYRQKYMQAGFERKRRASTVGSRSLAYRASTGLTG